MPADEEKGILNATMKRANPLSAHSALRTALSTIGSSVRLDERGRHVVHSVPSRKAQHEARRVLSAGGKMQSWSVA
jgi:hypothetical protein